MKKELKLPYDFDYRLVMFFRECLNRALERGDQISALRIQAKLNNVC